MDTIHFIVNHAETILLIVAVASEVLGFTKVGGIIRLVISLLKKK